MQLHRNTRVVEALARLWGDSDFQVVLDALEIEMRGTLLTMTTTKDEVALRWMQGSAQTLGELLDLSRQAQEIAYRSTQK